MILYECLADDIENFTRGKSYKFLGSNSTTLTHIDLLNDNNECQEVSVFVSYHYKIIKQFRKTTLSEQRRKKLESILESSLLKDQH